VKVLVTGASSLIGRHLAARLVQRGDVLTTLQRNPGGPPTEGVTEVLGSVDDPEVVERACVGQDAVIHLAAKVGVIGPWEEYERTNVHGTALLIERARSAGVTGFVHVSSPSVAHTGRPLIGASAQPADPLGTRGHYATSKATAEALALGETSSVMPIVAIRPHLVWGPGDAQLIGRIVERARQGRLALVGSGAALIDTTYVDNAADALIAAADRTGDLGGQAFVVSNGEPRTVYELVSRIVTAAGVDWSPRHVPASVATRGGAIAERVWDRSGRRDDPPMTSFLAEQLSTAHWFDQRSTRSALQWHPDVSLDEGFARLESWFKNL
jgi:nucleoside-diphosphate-sugar epimerase